MLSSDLENIQLVIQPDFNTNELRILTYNCLMSRKQNKCYVIMSNGKPDKRIQDLASNIFHFTVKREIIYITVINN